jgi:hypothetical protein
MAGENLISLQLTDEEMKEAEQAIAVFQKLSAKFLEISPDDRVELPKMGKKNYQFVQKSINIMELNPDLVPKYIDIVEVKKDFTLIEQLQKILYPLQSITRRVEDTAMVAGSEAYMGCISLYQALKTASRSNIPSARSSYNELRTYFPGGSRSTPADKTTVSAS